MSSSYITNSSACFLCSEGYKIHECKLFLNMSVAERNIKIKRKRLCIKYFKEYQGKNCKASNCKLCKSFHNTLLHKSKPLTGETINNNEIKASHNDSFSNSTKIHDTKQIITTSYASPSSVDLNHCTTRGPSQVLRSTAALLIHDSHGEVHKCRAL